MKEIDKSILIVRILKNQSIRRYKKYRKFKVFKGYYSERVEQYSKLEKDFTNQREINKFQEVLNGDNKCN